MDTWRLSFLDIDQSFNIPVPDTVFQGYMVVRAPKGEAQPIYFPRGQAAQINAMIGIPTADWPDLQDAIDFNNQFGLYISAPPGTDASYPSYYGGIYLTTRGLFPFYEVSEKDTPNYDTLVKIGDENLLFVHSSGTDSDVINSDITTGSGPDSIIISGVHSDILSRAVGIRFVHTERTYDITISGSNLNCVNPDTDEVEQVGTKAGDTFTIVGGSTFMTISSSTDYTDALSWIIDIQDDTYMYLVQKSPTEKTTRLTITKIGYDAYYYDLYIDGSITSAAPAGTVTDELYVVYNETTKKVYKKGLVTDTDVTARYKTRYIRIRGGDATLIDKLFYITTSGVMVEALVGTSYLPKDDPNYNTVTFLVEEEVYPGKWISGGTFTGSLDQAGEDSYGANIFFNEVLPDNAMTYVEVGVVRTFDNDVDATSGWYSGYKVIESRDNANVSTIEESLVGQRYVTKLVTDYGATDIDQFETTLEDGWTEGVKTAYEPVVLFMEPVGIEALKENLFALRASSHPLATYIAAKKITAAEALDPDSIVITGSSRGLGQYINEFLRKDAYTNRKYWSNLIGAVGTKLTRIMQDKMGGWAPMFTDTAGLGGQLTVAVDKAKYEFDKDLQKILDDKGLNTIILDPTYGVMIVNQKSTQDPTNLNDWSYLGHSMAFDLFKREVRDSVMVPQIGKPNDSFYQDMRRRQTESILNRRVGGTQPIWAAGKVEVTNVNTDVIKAQRKFKIKVTVKVNVFSEEVELEFVNVGQQVSV